MKFVTMLHETANKTLPAERSCMFRGKPEPEIQLPRILFESINFCIKILFHQGP